MITAHDFTETLIGRHFFGVDAKSAATALRKLADALEAGRDVALDSVRVQTLATHDDFAATIIRLKVFERKPPASPSYEVPSVPL